MIRQSSQRTAFGALAAVAAGETDPSACAGDEGSAIAWNIWKPTGACS